MAITGPASYQPTTVQFLTHWGAADSLLGAGNELILPRGGTRTSLQELFDLLGIRVTALQTKLTAVELARGEIETIKALLHLRLNQFCEKVRALHEGTKWDRALPLIPGIHDGQGSFLPPLIAANAVWVAINDDPVAANIILLGPVLQSMFAAQIGLLKAAYDAYHAAKTMADIEREGRNDIQDEIYEMLRQYRRNLPTGFVKGHAIVDSLPRLTPEPGSTPAAVTASIVWDAVQNVAKITWTASTDANLSEYEIRFCPGPDYSTDDESVIGTLSPTGPREFLTNVGLTNPGNVASFKVYVITSTGNEKGSNTVTVTRAA